MYSKESNCLFFISLMLQYVEAGNYVEDLCIDILQAICFVIQA